MLKVFKGPKGEESYVAFCDKFQKENPKIRAITLDAESPELEALLGELVASRDLFGAGVLCRGRRILTETKISEKELEKSATTFAFLEPEAKSKNSSRYKSNGPNLFVISDKLANKDKRGLWIEYERALLAGADAQDVYFTLQWQVRAMLATRVSKTYQEAGLKSEYPFNKSKRTLKNFKEGELENISNQLFEVWDTGHGGGQEFELALEQFILSV
ncbi:MAG: hypothetical protein A2749_00980 [Parcubacteria group bacterium RIFCSPHIGHO2_01_FULL_45_26]|nr:MAG: hypothetical protein A2749_00980 [Parcubacteria group bacterium RIFCSPHIGHO2_01_FULL_45_26]